MGWTGLHRDKGQSDREFFEQEFPNGLTQNGHILECATVGRAFYAAVRDHKDGNVWALIVLKQWGKGYYNFTYKEMSDREGPVEASAPERILNLLSPTDSEYATEWRARCRETAERRAEARKVKPGTKVRFGRAFTFSNGERADLFEFVGRSTFRLPSGPRCRIPSWRDCAFTVVA